MARALRDLYPMKRVILTAGLAAVLLSGCVSTRSVHGYVVEFGESGLDAIPGVDSRESVLARFGEPSIRPPLHNDTWYYISQQTDARAFFQTQVSSRSVVAFNFDDEGYVTEVAKYDLRDGASIDLVNRVTATKGKEVTFIEQLLGGVGQVAIPDGGGGPGAPGGPGGP